MSDRLQARLSANPENCDRLHFIIVELSKGDNLFYMSAWLLNLKV